MSHAKIWDKVLSDGEKVEYEFTVGNRYLKFGLIIWAIILAPTIAGSWKFALVVYLIPLFYYGFYLKAANAYAFTDKRVLMHTGWLSTHLTSIDYRQITDVVVKEPIIDRLLTKTGHIAVNTAGSSGKEVVLMHVTAPYDVKKRLDRIRDSK
jgi:uncharacterized membrane protein YdbT with pleckstrin-like domain